jgi:hypothetical protein
VQRSTTGEREYHRKKEREREREREKESVLLMGEMKAV